MELNQFITILLVINSIALGTFFGILRNKILSLEDNNRFHYFFYSLPILAFIASTPFIIFFWNEIWQPNIYAVIVLSFTVVSSVLLTWLTKKYMVIKNIYKSKELDPIVNDFTNNADKHNIRLFGGDLDFFGKNPGEMDQHPQYISLKSMGFRQIEILCAEPSKNADKIRYGKIIHDMPEVELRFYHPQQADLFVRGRMKEVHGVKKLLIYTKINTGVYKALEIDTADSKGALYNNIWGLVWSLATVPTAERIDEYKLLFQN